MKKYIIFFLGTITVITGIMAVAVGSYAADRINVGQKLEQGEQLVSNNGCFKVVMQNDGNLVLYNKENRPFWASNTAGQPNIKFCKARTDGKLVLYEETGKDSNNRPIYRRIQVWKNRGSASYMIMQDDGNLVIYDENGKPISASGTVATSLVFDFNPPATPRNFSMDQGEVRNFIVAVKNAGPARAKKFKVRMRVPGKTGGTNEVTVPCGPLDPGQVCRVNPGQSLYYPNTIGRLSIFTNIDPENRVPECIKHDNRTEYILTVNAK